MTVANRQRDSGAVDRVQVRQGWEDSTDYKAEPADVVGLGV